MQRSLMQRLGACSRNGVLSPHRFGAVSHLQSRAFSAEIWKLGQVLPSRTVPDHIDRPPYVIDPKVLMKPKEFDLKSAEDIELMRVSGRVASQIRSYAGSLCTVGRTTEELDALVHEKILSLDIYPSPLGYAGFPKSCCTSINQVVCHGIPDTRPLEDGDIINVDVSVWVGGFHGDCSGMFLVGNVDEESKKLVEVTRESLDEAIKICGPGVSLSKIGHTIHDIADKHGYGCVRNYCGHGIGRVFHMLPDILHYRNNYDVAMVPGMVFTIEPMITAGDQDSFIMEDDWTVVTKDQKRSAQFEEMLVITNDGVEVLTQHTEEVF